MGLIRRLLLNRFALVGLVWLAAIAALHVGQLRHNRLPLDLAREFPVGEPMTPGMALGTTLAVVMGHELDDNFGWRPNDFFLWGPRLWADNNAQRQLGILQAVRETVRVLKDHLTKVSSDQFDQNLVEADTMFRNDARKLWFPSAESRYRQGVQHMVAYVRGLKPELGTSKPIHQRHMELLRLFQAWTDLLGDAHANLYRTEKDGRRLRPWETDDLFYRAQGFAHVMAYGIEALERDYAPALAERETLRILFAEVKASLFHAALLKPFVVLDGPPAGLTANHRRNLDTYVTEARQKMYSIREELEK
jgi:hypothetical protein